MKKFLLSSLFVALFCLGYTATAEAQIATVRWDIALPGAQHEVEKAPCTVAVVGNVCPMPGTFTLTATVLPTAVPPNQYADGNVTNGGQYAYRVRTVCVQTATLNCAPYGTNLKSVPSGVLGVAIAIAPIPVPPPTNLSRITTAHTFTPSVERVTARWTAPARSRTTYVLTSDNGELRKGTLYSSDGNFNMSWFGIWKFNGKEQNIHIEVCILGTTDCVAQVIA